MLSNNYAACRIIIKVNINTEMMIEGARLRVPMIVHIVHRLDIGGMENGVVNLINRISNDQYQHVVICLTTYTDFRFRIQNPNVEIFALHKKEGKDLFVFVKLWRLLRKLKPDIVHTRNFATLECQVPTFLAGVKGRIHGEHGWDMGDLDGSSYKHRIVRRFLKIFVGAYIALSKDIQGYLSSQIKIPQYKINQVYNGVDTDFFHPRNQGHEKLPVKEFVQRGTLVIGTVGRMKAVKDQLTLAKAFLNLLEVIPNARNRLRLVLIGDGPVRESVEELLKENNATDIAWIPGSREDISNILRCLDIFVLPSLAEGISNTILEAMACGLPVVATKVGGNPELVIDGETGLLVPPSDPNAMADALKNYVLNPELMIRHGKAGRRRVEENFSILKMVKAYISIYEKSIKNGKSNADNAHRLH